MIDSTQDTSKLSILDLFQLEVKTQATILNEGLLALKTQSQSPQTLNSLIQAAHSVKGAAQIAEIDPAVHLADTLKNCFIATQNQAIALRANQVDVLQRGVDQLLSISQIQEEDLTRWLSEHGQALSNTIQDIASLTENSGTQGHGDAQKEDAETQRRGDAQKEDLGQGRGDTQKENVETQVRGNIEVKQTQEVFNNTLTTPPPPLSSNAPIGDTSMLELFRLEVEAQAAILNEGLLSLESQPQSSQALESLMRAAHSVKGAARIVALDAAVGLAHVMEDCFVAAQKQAVTLGAEEVDILLTGVDLLLSISQVEPEELNPWLSARHQEIVATRNEIAAILTPGAAPVPKVEVHGRRSHSTSEVVHQAAVTTEMTQPQPKTTTAKEIVKTIPSHLESVNQSTAQLAATERVVRVNADNLNRIMGLAGESLIEANWLQPFADSLTLVKKRQLELTKILENLQNTLSSEVSQDAETYLAAARQKDRECREILGDRLNELELFARRTASLSDRLYREVITSNMRPFTDGVQGFPRMIRDLAKQLGKQVKLDILGKSTPVDRDILKKLEAPLTHILRNSVDHGLELPEERLTAGKPVEGTVKLEAVHRGGMLSITITDDGRGINPEWLRQKVINKNLTTPEIAEQLNDSELMEFLFLPGFSTAKQVTEISGRGVGLDIAKSMAQEVGGTVRAISQPGKGTTFHFQLPLTLSVVRTLLVEISGEPYAFPLARIDQIVTVDKNEIFSMENRPYFTMDRKNIGLVAAYQVLELKEPRSASETLSVVVIGDQSDYYGLVVDRFLGERDLVVRPLDTRMGKVQDISAAALMGDGSPILIVDVSDLVRSIDNLLNNRSLADFSREVENAVIDTRKSILVVDDSITVREMERKLLQNKGYQVDVAVDGMEGWHAVSANHYDLVVSDIDMPRMNGIELVTKIKSDAKFNSIPIIIVSYKDREEDRIQGLAAGANYYLTKASFQDDSLVNAVVDLIGF
ncbi:MAG: response regulator [Rhizonema sp. PD38]|nr:response regulator [Rhizonema sp. PD38]